MCDETADSASGGTLGSLGNSLLKEKVKLQGDGNRKKSESLSSPLMVGETTNKLK